MEAKLSQLEDHADTIISKIVNSVRINKIPDLSFEEKEFLYKFIYMQWKRVPDLRNTVNTSAEADVMYKNLINELHTLLPERRIEISELQNRNTKSRIIQNCRVDLLEHFGEDVLSVFRKRGIAMLKIVAKDKKFIIGSRPVVKLTINGDYNLLNYQNELWLPIASDIAVGLDTSENACRIYPVTSRETIRSLNMAISQQNTIFAGESMALIKSLAYPK
ncbi:hypothetical protein SAE02_15860 [Skermanella aerolata]|uniref:DUF4238 domain-containing protein n=1 Tax=Skermanella aerolata TaxID=393310 RepID=A0A512DLT9_9PROT|nr:hypothetical protein SAE02_15860 [Skermanella aerolata]